MHLFYNSIYFRDRRILWYYWPYGIEIPRRIPVSLYFIRRLVLSFISLVWPILSFAFLHLHKLYFEFVFQRLIK